MRSPLRVYRPGIVVGHSETGEMDKIDGPYYFFKLIQRLRHALPEWFPLAGPEGEQTNIVPVDFVAKAMDHIAHMADASSRGHVPPRGPEAADRGRDAERVREGRARAAASRCAVDPNMTDIVPASWRKGLLHAMPDASRRSATQLLAGPRDPAERRWSTATSTPSSTRATPSARSPAPASRCRRCRTYADKLWDYWERNLDPDLFRERSLSSAVKGKSILITGASSGIGRQMAMKIGEAGGR